MKTAFTVYVPGGRFTLIRLRFKARFASVPSGLSQRPFAMTCRSRPAESTMVMRFLPLILPVLAITAKDFLVPARGRFAAFKVRVTPSAIVTV